jgi:hypothetical protein
MAAAAVGARGGVRGNHGWRDGGEHRRIGRRVELGFKARRRVVINRHAYDEDQRHRQQAEHHRDIAAAITGEIAKSGAIHDKPLGKRREQNPVRAVCSPAGRGRIDCLPLRQYTF